MRVRIRPSKAKSFVLLTALPLLLTVAYLTTHSSYYWGSAAHAEPPRTRRPASDHEYADWWVEFFTRLNNTQVTARPTKIKDKAQVGNWKPDVDIARPDLWKLSDEDEAKFRKSHAAIVEQLPEFARHLPYHAGTTGIVTAAGAENFGQAISMVLMTRQAGSRLPIEVVLDSSSAWIDSFCDTTMPRFNATCVYLEDMWVKLHPFVPKFVRYQWKAISIIASTFQNVLFLDADCLPVLNPDPILARGAEPFTSTGLITWPDFWTPSSSPLFYKIAGDVEVPPLTARPASESGILVFDKLRHADTLLLAAYYNYNGPRHYYDVLTQHSLSGDGDKETFLQAAVVLDALRRKGAYRPPTEWMRPGVGVRKGYWDVKKMPTAWGRTAKNKEWNGMFMQQMDPVHDYRVVMAAIEEARREAEAKSESKAEDRPEEKAAEKPGGESKKTEPEKSPISKSKRPTTDRRQGPAVSRGDEIDKAKTKTDVSGGAKAKPQSRPQPQPVNKPDDFLTDSSFLSRVGNLTLKHDEARFMFFHHNGVKPDFTRLGDRRTALVAVGDDDRHIRMWGDPGWIIERTGRDVEKLLWRDSMELYCRPDMARWRRVCVRMREIWESVYV